MINAIIIDDETKAISTLTNLLTRYIKNVEVTGTAKTIDEGIVEIMHKTPDVVFLDIQLASESGFELLNKIKNISFEIIFTTAHKQYAIDAIKIGALDYLLKPIDLKELKDAILKVIRQKNITMNQEKFELLIQNLKNSNANYRKISLPATNEYILLNLFDIIKCKADNNYAIIYTVDKKEHLVTKTLKDLEKIFNSDLFIRPHRSFLVNKNYIKRIVKGTTYYLELEDNSLVEIAFRRKERIVSGLTKN